MSSSFDICIRGSGIVGSTLALLLARQRLRIALVGQPAAANDVRAFALNAASRELLSVLRCWPDAEHATAVQSMQVCGDAGGQVFAIFIITDAAAEAAVGLGIMIAFFRNRETVLADEMDLLKW